MNKFTAFSVLVFGVLVALCSAYPTSYYGDYGNGYNTQGYQSYGGFGPAYPPKFGSGFDTYVYGSYKGHPGPYDSYSKPSYGGYNSGYDSGYNSGYNSGYQQTPYSYDDSYSRY